MNDVSAFGHFYSMVLCAEIPSHAVWQIPADKVKYLMKKEGHALDIIWRHLSEAPEAFDIDTLFKRIDDYLTARAKDPEKTLENPFIELAITTLSCSEVLSHCAAVDDTALEGVETLCGKILSDDFTLGDGVWCLDLTPVDEDEDVEPACHGAVEMKKRRFAPDRPITADFDELCTEARAPGSASDVVDAVVYQSTNGIPDHAVWLVPHEMVEDLLLAEARVQHLIWEALGEDPESYDSEELEDMFDDYFNTQVTDPKNASRNVLLEIAMGIAAVPEALQSVAAIDDDILDGIQDVCAGAMSGDLPCWHLDMPLDDEGSEAREDGNVLDGPSVVH
jgi:hypothetical protein